MSEIQNEDERKRSQIPMSDAEQRETKRSKASIQEIQLRLEDLWKDVTVFPVRAEAAFKEGGVLHGKEKVYLFCYACGPEHLPHEPPGPSIRCYVPAVVAIASSVEPSDKISIRQKESEKVIDMEKMNMAWVPCTTRDLQSPLPKIFMLSRVQTETNMEHFDLDPDSECTPYFFNPYKVGVNKQLPVVDIVYTTEAGRVDCQFIWSVERLKGVTNMLIDEGKLPSDHKDAFTAFAESKIEEGKRAYNEAWEKKIQDVEELRRNNEKAAAEYDNMRFYKFFPVATPDTPSLIGVKWSYINEYYGTADQVL